MRVLRTSDFKTGDEGVVDKEEEEETETEWCEMMHAGGGEEDMFRKSRKSREICIRTAWKEARGRSRCMVVDGRSCTKSCKRDGWHLIFGLSETSRDDLCKIAKGQRNVCVWVCGSLAEEDEFFGCRE